MAQTIIVIAIVAAAAAWAVWSIVRSARSGEAGCASCGTASSCPHAAKGACPSEVGDATGDTDRSASSED